MASLKLFQAAIYGRAVPFVTYGVLAFFAAISVLALPETRNAPLPASLDDCENYERFQKEDSGRTEKTPDTKRGSLKLSKDSTLGFRM